MGICLRIGLDRLLGRFFLLRSRRRLSFVGLSVACRSVDVVSFRALRGFRGLLDVEGVGRLRCGETVGMLLNVVSATVGIVVGCQSVIDIDTVFEHVVDIGLCRTLLRCRTGNDFIGLGQQLEGTHLERSKMLGIELVVVVIAELLAQEREIHITDDDSSAFT